MTRHALRIGLGILVLLVLLGHAVRWLPLPFLTSQDAFFYDVRARATAPGGVDERIVIVDLDEKSLSEVGRWPWGRDRMAQLVERLFGEYGVRVLGFDVVFAEPDESSGLRVLDRLGERQLRSNDAYRTALQSATDVDEYLAFGGEPARLGVGETGGMGDALGDLLEAVELRQVFRGRDDRERPRMAGGRLPDVHELDAVRDGRELLEVGDGLVICGELEVRADREAE